MFGPLQGNDAMVPSQRFRPEGPVTYQLRTTPWGLEIRPEGPNTCQPRATPSWLPTFFSEGFGTAEALK
jgi:hypothetical protein